VDFSEEEFSFCARWPTLSRRAAQRAFFQKAQEQAITDASPAFKTHRFSWKRYPRNGSVLPAGRAFALVLMDLDRFNWERFLRALEGDLVLQRVGQILRPLRRSDV